MGIPISTRGKEDCSEYEAQGDIPQKTDRPTSIWALVGHHIFQGLVVKKLCMHRNMRDNDCRGPR